jgi:tape measure domain-containing protein
MEPLHYVISADDKKFLDAITRDGRAMNNLLRETQSAGSGIESAFKKMGAAVGVSFGVGHIIREIVNIRGEIQQLGIAFETMLGGKAEADRMMQEVIAFAQKTPYTLTEVADNTKQLLAMGIETEKVMDTMRALGDVASGLSVPISRLAVNYGQVAALGKLQTREIRDFAMAGVPLMEELSKMTGRAKSEISGMVEAGEIGFPMVEQAFRNMSGEGGRFFNLMEKQTGSVTGQIARLKDQIELMMNAIGKSGEGAIYGAVNVTSKLVENYEEVGKTVAAMAATYGTYRAVLMSTAAVEGARASILKKSLTSESLQNVSKLNLTRGTDAYRKALQAELVAQQQRELSALELAHTEERRNYIQLRNVLATKEQTLANAQLAAATADAALATKGKATADAEATVTAKRKAVADAQSVVAAQKQALANAKLTLEAQKQALIEAKASEDAQKQTLLNAQKTVEAEKQSLVNTKTALATERKALTAARAELATEKKALAAAGSNVVSKTRIAQLEREVSLTAAKVAATESETVTISQNIRAKQAEIAANTGSVASTNFYTVAKNKLTAATLRLNAAMAANKYALIAAAVIALGYGIYKLVTYQTQAEKVTKDLNRELGAEEALLNVLVQRFKRTEKGTKEYSEAKKQLEERYGETLKNINLEVSALHDSESAYRSLTEEIKNNTKEKIRNKYIEQYTSESGEEVYRQYSGMRASIFKKLGEEAGSEFYTQVKDYIEKAMRYVDGEGNERFRMLTSEQNRELASMAESAGVSWRSIVPYINKIGSSNHILQRNLNELDGTLDGYTKTVGKSTDAGKESEKEYDNIAKKVAAVRENISALNKEIADLRSGKTKVEEGALKGLIESKLNELDEQEKLLKLYTGKDPKEERRAENEAGKRTDAQQSMLKRDRELALEQEKAALEAEQKMLDLEKDGFNRRMKQNELNYRKELQAIKEFESKKIEEQQKAARDAYVAEKGSDRGFDFSAFDLSGLPEGLRPEDIAGQVKAMRDAANDVLKSSDENVLNSLLEQYRNYAEQRAAIEKKFNGDIAALRKEREDAEKEGNTAMVNQLTSAIAQATKNKGKELISFDFNLLQESPDYVRAFENLKNTSTETLNELLSQLETAKEHASSVLDPSELREYTSAIQSIIDELTSRNPFKALAVSQKELTASTKVLAAARKALSAAQKGGDPEALARAQGVYRKALDDTAKANNRAQDAQKEVNEQMETLYESLRGIGNVIGGQAGEIINLIADIGGFVTTTVSGVKTVATAGATALATLEKASAILAIIQIAIQIIGKLNELVADEHEEYEKFAAKLAEVNKLRDAVGEYEAAVIKAGQAEENWFAADDIKSLHDAYDYNTKALDNYRKKLNETQAAYKDEERNGWLEKWFKGGGMAGSAHILSGDLIGAAVLGYFGTRTDYDKELKKAKDNLRIETRARDKGFWGTGIGGHSQQTKDLAEWAREQGLGELFDEDGMINIELSRMILDEYNDKLMGETAATLEALVDLKEQYNEYLEQLHEYVSSLYAPLVDNMIDSLWDWFDEGKDALDSFKDYASDTFRDIVSDMLRTIMLRDIVGHFQDDITELYKQHAEGKLTVEELMRRVAEVTSGLVNDYKSQLPALQGVLDTVAKGLDMAGIDLKQTEEDARQGAKGLAASMTQDQATEMNGFLNNGLMLWRDIASNTGSIMDILANQDTGNSAELMRNYAQNALAHLANIDNNTGRLEAIEKSISSMDASIDEIKTRGIVLRK